MNQTVLINFNYKISDFEVLTQEYDFYNFYNSNIVNLCKQLKDEITENLLSLDSDKHLIYLELVCDTLEKSPFYNAKPFIIDKWLTRYKANIEDFPNFNHSELYNLLKINDYYNQLPYHEFSHIENVQVDFYIHFAMLETKKLFEHTKQLKVKYTAPNSNENLEEENYLFEKDKSLEHNLSKLTVFPIVVYDSGELQRIYVNTTMSEQFTNDFCELKAVIIEQIFKNVRKLTSAYKLIFAKNLVADIQWRIESSKREIKMVENNLLKADVYVLDILTMSLNMCEEVFSNLQSIILIEEGETITEPKDKIKLKKESLIEPTHSIFIDNNSENLFNTILEQMGVEENNIHKRGNQAKLHAIWEVSTCKEKLFSRFKELGDYTNFLNKKFGTTYESRNFSDGSKHHNNLKILLNDIK